MFNITAPCLDLTTMLSNDNLNKLHTTNLPYSIIYNNFLKARWKKLKPIRALILDKKYVRPTINSNQHITNNITSEEAASAASQSSSGSLRFPGGFREFESPILSRQSASRKAWLVAPLRGEGICAGTPFPLGGVLVDDSPTLVLH